MSAKPKAPARSSSFNKLFPDGGEPVMPSKFLQILPWLCVIEAFGLIFYNLAEAAHLMFPLMQPSAEFLAAMKIPAVGTMYSCLWVGHAVGDTWVVQLYACGDTLKKNMQAGRSGAGGVLSEARGLLREGGVARFYRGYAARFVIITCNGALFNHVFVVLKARLSAAGFGAPA